MIATRSRAAAVAAAVTALAVAGCAGPRTHLEVGTKTAPVSIVLGAHRAVTTAPVGPLALPPLGPGIPLFPPLPLPTTTPTVGGPPTPRPAVCPAFDPLAPVVRAGSRVDVAPVAGSYPYRSDVQAVVGETREKFAGISQWVVSAPRTSTHGTFEFDVTTRTGRYRTVRTFVVVTEGSANVPTVKDPTGQLPSPPPLFAAPDQPGIYLSSYVDSGGARFTPQPMLPLAQFPIVERQTFRGVGTDGTTTWTYLQTVEGRVKVNACGTPVEGWRIRLTDGSIARSISGTAQSVTFTDSFVLSPQFGGLIVDESTDVTGSQLPATPLTRHESYTTDTPPRAPRATG